MTAERATDAEHAGWHPPAPPEVSRPHEARVPRHLEPVPSTPEAGELTSDKYGPLGKLIEQACKEITGLRISEAGKLQPPLNSEVTNEDRKRMEEFEKLIDEFLQKKGIQFPAEFAVNPDYATVDDDGPAEIARARARALKLSEK